MLQAYAGLDRLRTATGLQGRGSHIRHIRGMISQCRRVSALRIAYFHVLEHAYEQTHMHTCMYACTYVCILLLHQCVDASITKASPDLCGSVKSTAVVLRPGTTVRNMPVSTDSAKPWTTRQRSQSLKVCMNVRNYVHKYMCLNCTVLHCIALAWIGLYCFVLYCL